jgi:hypothetical protein
MRELTKSHLFEVKNIYQSAQKPLLFEIMGFLMKLVKNGVESSLEEL